MKPLRILVPIILYVLLNMSLVFTEIEVSGLTSSGKYDATIYVWENGVRVIESIQDIHSKEELAKHLEILLAKYPDIPG